jgi:signal recognition particle subunit SRP68
MSMKVAHSTDTKGITGSTRSHIISRLHKARITVDSLIQSLSDRAITKATDTDLLEVRAYATSLSGAEDFEKQNWEPCVKSYSTAWIIYSALFSSAKNDIFKDLLTSSIEPSIRYAAYQMKLSRTVAIPVIARKYFANGDTETLNLIEKISPGTVSDTSKINRESAEVDAASRAITWRSRTVALEDAAIAVALSSVTTALKTLSETLSSASTSRERASAYDDILIASQDAVDASKHAIDELVTEGVSQGDPRMQSLQITRTATSYDLISWRIGRNRVLVGDADGALPDSAPISRHKKTKNDVNATVEKEEGTGRKLAHLREKVALYDATLQSLDSIKELAGIARDTEFVQELDAKNAYFRALKYSLASQLSYYD